MLLRIIDIPYVWIAALANALRKTPYRASSTRLQSIVISSLEPDVDDNYTMPVRDMSS